MSEEKPTAEEIKRLSDLNRVAGYLESLCDAQFVKDSGVIRVAEKALKILEPHLPPLCR